MMSVFANEGNLDGFDEKCVSPEKGRGLVRCSWRYPIEGTSGCSRADKTAVVSQSEGRVVPRFDEYLSLSIVFVNHETDTGNADSFLHESAYAALERARFLGHQVKGEKRPPICSENEVPRQAA